MQNAIKSKTLKTHINNEVVKTRGRKNARNRQKFRKDKQIQTQAQKHTEMH